MKKALFILFAAFFSNILLANSQQINISIGNAPDWVPREKLVVRYYYLPEIESYYDVSRRQFIYIENNRWVHRSSLPTKYRKYDLYKAPKIAKKMDKPYKYFDNDRKKYHNMKKKPKHRK